MTRTRQTTMKIIGTTERIKGLAAQLAEMPGVTVGKPRKIPFSKGVSTLKVTFGKGRLDIDFNKETQP